MKKCVTCGKEFPETDEYFTVKKKGNIMPNPNCKKCEKEIKAEKSREASRKWCEKNKEKRKEYSKSRYKENKEKIKEYGKKYYKENREERKEYQRKWKEENREKIQNWTKNNMDKKYNSMKKRIKAKSELPNTLTENEWNMSKEYFDKKCAYCGKELPLTQDHFVPISKGGGYTKENIIPSCGGCNSSKGTKEFSEWYSTYKHYDQERKNKILEYTGN